MTAASDKDKKGEPGPAPGRRVLLKAPAKINLNLLVGPAREDGYHELDSYVCKINLYDSLAITPRLDELPSSLTCTGIDCGPVGDNLALKAARLFRERVPDAPPVDIELEKNIPPGTGLGGGSSDAASVLMAMNNLAGAPVEPDALALLAAELGSDVPLFLGPNASRMTGRGEKIEPATVHQFSAILLIPDLHCSTAEVYRQFDRQPHPLAQQLNARMLAQRPPSQWRRLLMNDLAPAAMAVCPPLAALHARVRRLVDKPVHLTGSGCAMFILCDDDRERWIVWQAIPEDVRPICHEVQLNRW
jgi:4-diphosphocytidyl-2-C-methyl-D-erythritol kinase